LAARRRKKVPAVRTIAGGASVIVFFLLDLGESKAASHINHSLHLLDESGEAHDVVPAPLSVEDESPIPTTARRLDLRRFPEQRR